MALHNLAAGIRLALQLAPSRVQDSHLGSGLSTLAQVTTALTSTDPLPTLLVLAV